MYNYNPMPHLNGAELDAYRLGYKDGRRKMLLLGVAVFIVASVMNRQTR